MLRYSQLTQTKPMALQVVKEEMTLELAIEKKKSYKLWVPMFISGGKELLIKSKYGRKRKFTSSIQKPEHNRINCTNQAREFIDTWYQERATSLYESQILFTWLVICARDESMMFVDNLDQADKQQLDRFLNAASKLAAVLETKIGRPENQEVETNTEFITEYIRKTMKAAKDALFTGKGDDFDTFLTMFSSGNYEIKKR